MDNPNHAVQSCPSPAIFYLTNFVHRLAFFGFRFSAAAVLAKELLSNDSGRRWFSLFCGVAYLFPLCWSRFSKTGREKFCLLVFGALIMTFGLFLKAFSDVTRAAFLLIAIGYGLVDINHKALFSIVVESASEADRTSAFLKLYLTTNVAALVAGLFWEELLVRHLLWWIAGFCGAIYLLLMAFSVYRFAQSHAKAESLNLKQTGSRPQDERMLWILILTTLIFWVAFEQIANSFNLQALEIACPTLFGLLVPAGVLQAINPLCILLFIGFLLRFPRKNHEGSISQICSGLFLSGAALVTFHFWTKAFSGACIPQESFVLFFAFLTLGELLVEPIGQEYVSRVAQPARQSYFLALWGSTSGLGALAGGFAPDASPNYWVLVLGLLCLLSPLLLWKEFRARTR